MSNRSVIVIPARYQSSRFPGKALAQINGRTMVEHVYRRAEQVQGIDEVILATDSDRIRSAVEAFGGKAVMTSPEHRSGTERVAEVARGMDVDIVVNVQGDEPLISPRAIEAAIEPLHSDTTVPMVTLMTKAMDDDDLHDPNVVKVVVDRQGWALYFSRSLIPYRRGKQQYSKVYRHIGLYAYRREVLVKLTEMTPTPLEKTEKLEQLRVLENGFKIRVVETDYHSISVDTPDQLRTVIRMMEGE